MFVRAKDQLILAGTKFVLLYHFRRRLVWLLKWAVLTRPPLCGLPLMVRTGIMTTITSLDVLFSIYFGLRKRMIVSVTYFIGLITSSVTTGVLIHTLVMLQSKSSLISGSSTNTSVTCRLPLNCPRTSMLATTLLLARLTASMAQMRWLIRVSHLMRKQSYYLRLLRLKTSETYYMSLSSFAVKLIANCVMKDMLFIEIGL